MEHRFSTFAAASAVSLAIATAAVSTGGAATPLTSGPAAHTVIHPGHNWPSATARTAGERNLGWESTNWSGYAVSGQGISAASGNWTVPTVQPSSKAEYSATWVGVDGFNNQDLIQVGTGQDTANGATHYYAWWEVLPNAETTITTMPVAPGDSMRAWVAKVAAGSWKITLLDHSTGVSFSTTVSYGGPGTSAEWIEEAPTVGGHQATMANFGRVQFTNGTINNQPVRLTSDEGGAEITQSGTIVAEPSAPDSTGSGFTENYVAPTNGHKHTAA